MNDASRWALTPAPSTRTLSAQRAISDARDSIDRTQLLILETEEAIRRSNHLIRSLSELLGEAPRNA